MRMLKLNKRCFFLLGIIVVLVGCKDFSDVRSNSFPINHQAWDKLLKKHVNKNGAVDYKGFISDSLSLNNYLAQLSKGFPNKENWSEKERLAYWINAYNAFTIQIVIRNYPVESIKDIGPALSVPFINSVWDINFILIETEMLSLNHIEHNILRKEFEEPRIHFAINCASKSCPPLRREAYTASELEAQLQEQALLFINDATYNTITKDEVEVSKIFSWFSGDFKKEGTLIDFLNQYVETKIDRQAEVDFKPYDWNLNE